VVSLAGTALLGMLLPANAAAQDEAEAWTTPVNLSHSGASRYPRLVLGSGPDLLVVWQDAFAGFVYARSDGTSTSEPEIANLSSLFGFRTGETHASDFSPPSGLTTWRLEPGSSPLFVPGTSGFVHAFWIEPDGRLYFSRVSLEGFGNAATSHWMS
jgi:hypothetical protein